MKLKIIIMALLLLAGIGSAVNRLPATEFVGNVSLSDGIGISFDEDDPGQFKFIPTGAYYDGLVTKRGGVYYGYAKNGSLIASHNTDAAVVFNAVVDVVRQELSSQSYPKILFDGDVFEISTPMYLYSFMEVSGVAGKTVITSSEDIEFFLANQTDGLNNRITISNLYLLATNGAYTKYQITIYNPTSCEIYQTSAGGVLLSSNTSSTWLNIVRDSSNLGRLKMVNITDSFISNCFISNGGQGHACVLENSGNNRAINNHYLATGTGNCCIYVSGTSRLNTISNSHFETGWDANNTCYGIVTSTDASFTDNIISYNTFGAVYMYPIFLRGDSSRNIINGNIFDSCNTLGTAISNIRLDASTSGATQYNIVSGNSFIQTGAARSRAIFEYDDPYDPNWNLFHGNVVSGTGYYSDAIYVVGANTSELDNIGG